MYLCLAKVRQHKSHIDQAALKTNLLASSKITLLRLKSYVSYISSPITTIPTLTSEHGGPFSPSPISHKPSSPQESSNLKMLQPLLDLPLRLPTIHLHQLPRPHIINAPMNLHPPLIHHRSRNLRILPHNIHPRLHIRLHQHQPFLLIPLALKLPLRLQLTSQFPERHQPSIHRTPNLAVPQRRSGPAAGSMAADNYVADFQDVDGEEDDGLDGEIVGGDDVRDVPVDEYFARLGAQEGGFRAAGVGAAEPEEGGGLAFCAGGEEVRFAGGGFLVPLFVGGEEFVERV